jgi:uncharacterized protein (TIGR00106 family)
MLFGVSVIPIGEGPSILGPVSRVIEKIITSGLPYEVTGMNTVVEGDWDTVMPVLREAEREVRQNHGRIFMVITIDDRPNGKARLRASIDEVEQTLGRAVAR